MRPLLRLHRVEAEAVVGDLNPLTFDPALTGEAEEAVCSKVVHMCCNDSLDEFAVYFVVVDNV